MDEHVGFGRYVFYCADEEYDFPVDQGALSVLQDLKEMKADGFNTVRLINFVIKKTLEAGFTVKIDLYPLPNDNEYVNMYPPYSGDPAINPVCAKYFDMILQTCTMANSLDMKVSVEVVTGDAIVTATVGDAMNNDQIAFLQAFASFIHAHQVHNLIGYEFAGEPTLASANIPTLRTRHDLCELVTSWNDDKRCGSGPLDLRGRGLLSGCLPQRMGPHDLPRRLCIHPLVSRAGYLRRPCDLQTEHDRAVPQQLPLL
jgi:hypothetical protein